MKAIQLLRSAFAYSILILWTLGCSSQHAPDLKRLYSLTSQGSEQTPVILIHGISGSKIRNKESNEELWPGGAFRLLFSSYDSLRLKIDENRLEPVSDDQEAYALVDGLGGEDYYHKIVSTLTDIGGYSITSPSNINIKSTRSLYLFVYDWRQDLAQVAGELDRFIDKVRHQHHNPALKVDIVAHSMGGLLTRYFLLYGAKNVLNDRLFRPTLAGAEKVRQVVLIGTPNFGSVKGLQIFMMGYPLGFNRVAPETLLTMPSMYELLPHPKGDWMIGIDGKKLDRDLYSVDTWRSYHWSIFDPVVLQAIRQRFKTEQEAKHYVDVLERYFEKNLKRARNFHLALSAKPDSTKKQIHYILFGGDCSLTPARCLIENVNDMAMVRLNPSEITNPIPGINYEQLMLEPGDGSVTKPSLLGKNSLDPSNIDSATFLPMAYSVFLCKEHTEVPGDVTFQDNLLNVLLAQETTEDRMTKHTK